MLPLSHRMLLLVFSLTLFLSASLLFWVQPLLAKMLLPHLGGSPSVWNTCMMFFQGILLAGYLYAHLCTRYIPSKWQLTVHLSLLAIGLFFLPLKIDQHWLGIDESPISNLTHLLFITAALPLFAISASAPLLQRWFSTTDHPTANDPYYLYAASNAGSLLALVAFPFLLEPWMSLSLQTWSWSLGFAALLILSLICGLQVSSSKPTVEDKSQQKESAPLTWFKRGHCILLAFVPSSLLLGITTYITTDIASTPLFWIVPLILYLISFILVFAARPIIHLKSNQKLQMILLVPAAITLTNHADFLSYWLILILHLTLFFCTAITLHGELAAQRPHTKYLTEFYLLMSIGGLLGGVFNAIIAPLIFANITEYPIILALAVALKPPTSYRKEYVYSAIFLFLVFFNLSTNQNNKYSIYSARNFFGTSRVTNLSDEVHKLYHGTTLHGLQIKDKAHQKSVLAYYFPLVEIVENLHQNQTQLTMGIVGLGTGMTACLAKVDDHLTYFEINPEVVKIANNQNFFNYLQLCPPKGGVILGDARLRLRAEKDQRYDLLVMDAFNSDAIPVHLITEQAILLYFEKLKPNGLLMVHISNRHIDLKRVLSAISKPNAILAVTRNFKSKKSEFKYAAEWVALSKSNGVIQQLTKQGWKVLPTVNSSHRWTDDYSNILREIKGF